MITTGSELLSSSFSCAKGVVAAQYAPTAEVNGEMVTLPLELANMGITAYTMPN